MDYRIETVLRVIESDIGRDCHPAQLAGEVRLSVSRFYELFRRETGTVPARYLRACRFEKARELLLTTDLRVKEVAHQVGLHDVSHFVRDFEKAFGLSPRSFRRASRQAAAAASGEASPTISNTGQVICDPSVLRSPYTEPSSPAAGS